MVARLAERCVQSDGELATYCVNLCDEAFNPRSVLVWRYVLRAESKIFEVCKNAICSESLDRALKTLASLRLDDHCAVKADIDLVFVYFSHLLHLINFSFAMTVLKTPKIDSW